jgi:hypothetical protein
MDFLGTGTALAMLANFASTLSLAESTKRPAVLLDHRIDSDDHFEM